jgi:hypothetical protein
MVNLHGLLHVADDKPFVMAETVIFDWLTRRWAMQKAPGINLALAAAASAANAAEGEDVDDEGGVHVDYGSMLVAPLRDLLRSRQLSRTGNKTELIARLRVGDIEGVEQPAQGETGEN